MGILDEINQALATNEAFMDAIGANGPSVSPGELNNMSIDELTAVLASISASDLVRRKATALLTAYERKKQELQAERKHSPKEIETQAIEAMKIAKMLWAMRGEE